MSNKLFFVHIPKTAGNAVRETLNKHAGLTNPGKLKKERIHHFGRCDAYRRGHRSFKTPYFPCYAHLDAFNNAKLSFTVIRNPFDLLVSYYIHDARGTGKDTGWADVNKFHNFKTFEEFIQFFCTCNAKDWHVPLLNENLFSQIFDGTNSIVIDYAIYYENLAQGLGELLKLVRNKKRNYKLHMKNINVSTTRSNRRYQEFYTPELRNLVEEKCQWELKTFNYFYDIKTTQTLIQLK